MCSSSCAGAEVTQGLQHTPALFAVHTLRYSLAGHTPPL